MSQRLPRYSYHYEPLASYQHPYHRRSFKSKTKRILKFPLKALCTFKRLIYKVFTYYAFRYRTSNMARCRQFWLLIWKNFVLQKRHPWVTLFELGVPTLFSILLMVIRTRVDSDYISAPTYYKPFPLLHNQFIQDVPQLIRKGSKVYQTLFLTDRPVVSYAPNETHVNEVMSKVGDKLKSHVIGYETEEIMLNQMLFRNDTIYKALAIVFPNEYKRTEFAEEIYYKVRLKSTTNAGQTKQLANWKTQLVFPVFQGLGPREKNSYNGGDPGYLSEGFLTLQHAVAASIVERFNQSYNDSELDIKMQRYPYPPYYDDNFLIALQFFFPLALLLSFIYPSLNIVKNIVLEKERRLKESMKMMGLSNWLHWLAWFIKYLMFLSISVAVMTIVLTVKVKGDLGVLDKIDPFLLFIFLLLYTISTIAFCFLISVFFSKANSAAAGAGILFFFAFVPYFIIFPRYNEISNIEKIASCLLSNTALALGAIVISMWEGTGAGANFNNWTQTTNREDSLSMFIVFSMLVFDTVLYMTLAWYIEAVFPGEFGVPQPWYFPFMPSYWCGTTASFDQSNDSENDPEKSQFCEKEPVGLIPGIQILGLGKVYAKNKVAVNNISLNMYKSQITALLGHNGAGKTTTISMLTGLFAPTFGTAIINGYDIQDDIEGVHSSLGICPQHDVLFDELTVEEHLYFFCKLKGYLPDLIESEVNRMVVALGLEAKRKTFSRDLSGGMKRKLSVGMALVGGSQVVMLDEPTSGMDPAARRSTWDLLQSEKEDRTILLTTHFMEEADILGDRIAIMAAGEVQCSGSPLFLKKKYGAGYHLVVVKGSDCDVTGIMDLIYAHIPSAELESNIGAELSFSLPHDSSGKFSALFNAMEDSKEILGIDSYGASITTMEEVFLRVGEYSQTAMTKLKKDGGGGNATTAGGANNLTETRDDIKSSILTIDRPISEDSSGLVSSSQTACLNSEPKSSYSSLQDISGVSYKRHRGFILFRQQFISLMKKRMLHTYRHWLLTLSQFVLPVLFITITLIILKTLPKPGDSPERVLDLNMFDGTTVPYSVGHSEQSQRMGDIFNEMYAGTRNSPFNVAGNGTITALFQYLIDLGVNDLPYYNMHNMIAAYFNENDNVFNVTALFNNQAYHTPGVTLTAIYNVLLKYFGNNSKRSMVVSNHPLPRTISEKTEQQQNQGTEAYQLAQDFMFALAFLMGSFSIFLVKERSTKSKHLQRVSGVNLIIFWCTTFLWDFINYILPCILVQCAILAFQTEALIAPAQQARLFLLFVLYGFAGLPFIYTLSFLFTVPSTAYTRLCLFNIVAGIGCLLAVTILEIPLLNLQHIAVILDWLFTTFLPHYCLGRAMFNLYQNYEYVKICSLVQPFCNVSEMVKRCCKDKCGDNCLNWSEDYLSWDIPGIGRLLTFLVIQSVLYTVLLFACEQNLFRKLRYVIFQRTTKKITPSPSRSVAVNDQETMPYHSQPETAIVPYRNNQTEVVTPGHVTDESIEPIITEDEDVLQERSRILNNPLGQLQSTDSIIIRDLCKVYGSLVAVDGLCLGIRKGECFGLLGLNGAGKTTTFKMLTGDEVITSGNAYMDGFNVKTDLRLVQQRIGYCPQFDAVIDQMTGRETLRMFANLRGVPQRLIDEQINFLGRLLYFDMHLGKLVKDFSGGNKRKLSMAIALIGDSPIIFLDEPTTGMDPVARRCLWDAIIKIVHMGRSVVLTSHSMEECEALCNRLVIMVNGRLCCLGSPQHLKNKFGQGFTLLVKIGRYAISSQNSGPPAPLENGEAQLVSVKSFDTVEDQSESAGSRGSRVGSSTTSTRRELSFAQNVEAAKEFIESKFEGSVLKSVHQGLLHYQIKNMSYTWAQLFDTMEKAKDQLNIENYSVGQTSLEQVFLNFTRAQRHTADS